MFNKLYKPKQAWYPGATVNVGFQKGLIVVGQLGDGSWRLVNKAGHEYTFTPYQGLTRE